MKKLYISFFRNDQYLWIYKSRIGILLVCLLTLLQPRATAAGDSDWISHAAPEDNNEWRSVAYGNETFVAVAANGTHRVMTSPDGINWTVQTAVEANLWMSVTYGGGQFVAVAMDGFYGVMTSPDGINWTPRTAAKNSDWKSVVYGNGKFVAVSATGAVMSSPDGIVWTLRTTPASGEWSSVTYGGDKFVAVANKGTHRVMSSSDGVTWTVAAATEVTTWRSVTYGNGRFVAVANSGTNRVMTSTDGTTWTTVSTGGISSGWWGIVYSNGRFVVVGVGQSMTSTDGVTWTELTMSDLGNAWYSVTYGNGKFVAVSQNGTNRVMTYTPPSPKTPQTITFNEFPAYKVGDGPVTLSATSSSGLSVSYSSSNTNVATVTGNILTIVGTGTTEITATQQGNDDYLAAVPVKRNLKVSNKPSFTSTPVTEAKYHQSYSYSVTATKEDGLETTIVAENLPSWLNLEKKRGLSLIATSSEQLCAMAKDNEGNIYIASYEYYGIEKINKSNGQIGPVGNKNLGMVRSMEVYNGYLYISRVNEAKITRIPLSNPQYAAEENVLTNLSGVYNLKVYKGELYASVKDKIIKINTSNKTYETFLDLPGATIKGFAFNGAGTLYFSESSPNARLASYNGSMVTTVLTKAYNDVEIDENGVFYLADATGVTKYSADLSVSEQIYTEDAVIDLVISDQGIVFTTVSNFEIYKNESGTFLTGTPKTDDIGIHSVRLKASNDAGSTIQEFDITVSGPATLSGFSDISKIYGDAPFALTAPQSNNKGGIITYSSSDPTIASVSGNMVTIHKTGKVTITATQEAYQYYTESSITAELTINNKPSFTSTPVTEATYNQSYSYSVTATKEGGLETTIVAEDLPSWLALNTGINVSTLAGSTKGVVNGKGIEAQFDTPAGVVADAEGNIYVAEYGNSLIRKITADGQVSTFAGSTFGYADGIGTAAKFNGPQGMAIDASGNIYIAERGASRIRKITPQGLVSTIAGSGTNGNSNGVGTAASFNKPTGIAIDPWGNIYIADDLNHSIRKITPNGTVSTFAGNGTAGYADGVGVLARFNRPTGIITDALGNVYVSESSNYIRKITPNGTVSTFAGNGTAGYADGPGTSAMFNSPQAMVMDASDNIYVSESSNHRIRKITPAGEVSTVAGKGVQGNRDGTKEEAQFWGPVGIALDMSGNIYVAEWSNHRIRKITQGITLTGTPGITDVGINPVALKASNTVGSTSQQFDITVSGPAILKNFANINKTYGDAVFTLSQPGSNNTDGTFTYVSNNPAVASVNGNKVTILKSGIVKITAKQAAHSYFTETTIESTLTVAKAPLTITVDNKEKFVGTVNPILTITYSGFVNGENENVLTSQPIVSTSADNNSPIADYPILVSSAMGDNYNISYQPGILKVKPGGPTNIFFTEISLYENSPKGTVSGSFSSTSEDPTATFNYSLVAGQGGEDNGKFIFDGNQLKTLALLDYEQKQTYFIRVRSTTQHGFWLEKEFIVNLKDVNEAPTIDFINDQEICYNTIEQRINLTGITPGPESWQQVTLNVSGNNPDLLSLLEINNGQIRYRVAENKSGVVLITVAVKDNGGTDNGGIDEVKRIFQLRINSLPKNVITSDRGNKISKGEIANLTVNSDNGITYIWSPASGVVSGQNSAVLSVRPMVTTTYSVAVRNSSGCETISSFTVEVEDDYLAIAAENFITPNGDGVNDTWVINNIDAYPDHTLTIVDRSGKIVYAVRNYQNDWNGTLNGQPLAEGTYYYIIRFDQNQPNLKMAKGFITIVRSK